jgi:hypothetical protein
MILTIAGANFSGANIGANTNVGSTLTKGNGVSGSKVSSLTLEKNKVVSTSTKIADLSLQTGYENLVVTVTMTGTGDVSSWFSNGTVTIPSGTTITGNIKITASATAVSGGSGEDIEVDAELTPYIVNGIFIDSKQIFSLSTSSKVYVYKVKSGSTYTLSAQIGPNGVDSNKNLIYAPIKDVDEVKAGSAVNFIDGYTERIVVRPDEADTGATGVSATFEIPSNCEYIALSNYNGGAILTVVGPYAGDIPGSEDSGSTNNGYYYGGIELYSVVEKAYVGNSVPTKLTSDNNSVSQVFEVEPNSTYTATCVNTGKQIVYVQLKSLTGLTIGGTLDFATSHSSGERTVCDYDTPAVINTSSDCNYILFSGYRKDGTFQHVKLEKN